MPGTMPDVITYFFPHKEKDVIKPWSSTEKSEKDLEIPMNPKLSSNRINKVSKLFK